MGCSSSNVLLLRRQRAPEKSGAMACMSSMSSHLPRGGAPEGFDARQLVCHPVTCEVGPTAKLIMNAPHSGNPGVVSHHTGDLLLSGSR